MTTFMAILWLTQAFGQAQIEINAPVNPLDNPKLFCRAQVTDLLKKWGASKEWRGNLGPQGFQSLAPTKELGVWTGVRISEIQIELTLYTPGETLNLNIQKDDCKSQMQIAKPTSPVWGKDTFSDDSLKELLKLSAKDRSSGVIYIWSPQMNLSILGAKEVEKISKELKLKLTLIKETNVQSNELFFRGVRNHFPSLIFYSKGQLNPKIKTGYDKPNVLKSVLRSYASM